MERAKYSSVKSQLQFVKKSQKPFVGQGRTLSGQTVGIYAPATGWYFHRPHKEKIIPSAQYKLLTTCVFYLKVNDGKFYRFSGSHLLAVCGQTGPYYKKSFVNDIDYSNLLFKMGLL